MGLLLPGDLGGGPVGQEHLGHIAAQGIADAGGELAVREGARAPFAKLDVGVLVQLAGGGKMLHRPDPFFQGGAPLQHEGSKALLRQGQGRKQARRPQPADHRAAAQPLGAGRQAERRLLTESNAGRGPCVGRFLTLIFQRDRYGIDELGPAVAGVHRKAGHPHLPHLVLGQAQNGQRPGFRLLLPLGEGQADISDQDHGFVHYSVSVGIVIRWRSHTGWCSCPGQTPGRPPGRRCCRRCSAAPGPPKSRRRRCGPPPGRRSGPPARPPGRRG